MRLSRPCTMAFTWDNLSLSMSRIIFSYLARLHNTGKLSFKLVVTAGNNILLDPPAAVVNQDCPESQLIGVEGGGCW